MYLGTTYLVTLLESIQQNKQVQLLVTLAICEINVKFCIFSIFFYSDLVNYG